MRKYFYRIIFYLIILFPLCVSLTYGQQKTSDVLLQGFYWNTHPGDITTDQGIWWDTLATVASELADMGFQTVWVPPPTKGSAGVYDMGYGLYDYYDLGEFNQKGIIRTRFGNKSQLLNMISVLHNAGLKIMVDVVLNHRGGGDSQEPEACDDGDGRQNRYTIFSPLSGRLPGNATDFHPNPTHCNLDAPYHNRIFFEDICYFDGIDGILNAGAAQNGWYFGPHQLGHMGDSLIVWGRWLIQNLGFDELRLDAVKHIEPGFIAPFLVELKNGNQPFAVGEFFDEDMAYMKSWHDDVESFITTYGTGTKNANIALFDFNLRSALRDMCNNTSGTFDMSTLNSRGFRFFSNPLDAEDIVTFVENHDKDRIGWVVTTPDDPEAVQYGSTYLKLSTDSGHDPIISDKHMAYAYIMASEGRPTVFWKDIYWYHLKDVIEWLMALRKSMATGISSPLNQLNPFYQSGNSGDFFAFIRNGSGSGVDGCILALNDSPTNEQQVWINTPFTNKELKDYSDQYLFNSTYAYSDKRALIKTPARKFTWYGLTGLYPHPPGIADSKFSLQAQPGGKLHFVALRASDAANFLVNGTPIQKGDEIAIFPQSATLSGEAVGIGRIGQKFRWDGVHDMIIEVLGGESEAQAGGGLLSGSPMKIVVYDSSQGNFMVANTVQYAVSGTNFQFIPNRPSSMGGNTPISVTTNSNDGNYSVGGISLIVSFNASDISLSVTVTNLKAEWKNNAVQLSWQTQSEVNNLGFEIWRKSDDENTFQKIASYLDHKELQGHINSSSPVSYLFRDVNIFPSQKYYYKISDLDVQGNRNFYGPVQIIIPFYQSDNSKNSIEAFRLYPNYPNPFNSSTNIPLQIGKSKGSEVYTHLRIYSLTGDLINDLFSGYLKAGEYIFQWDGTDSQGTSVASGVYVVSLRAGTFQAHIKVLIIH